MSSDDRERLNRARVRGRVGENPEYVARPQLYAHQPVGVDGWRFTTGGVGEWIRVGEELVEEVEP